MFRKIYQLDRLNSPRNNLVFVSGGETFTQQLWYDSNSQPSVLVASTLPLHYQSVAIHLVQFFIINEAELKKKKRTAKD